MFKREDIVKALKDYVVELSIKNNGISSCRVTLREDLTPEYFKTLIVEDFHNKFSDVFISWCVTERTTKVIKTDQVVSMQVVDAY